MLRLFLLIPFWVFVMIKMSFPLKREDELFKQNRHLSPSTLQCLLPGRTLGSKVSAHLWCPSFRERELLQKTREELQQQLEVLEQEAWRLRRTNMELQLQGDSAQGEKEEQQEELHLVVRERERL